MEFFRLCPGCGRRFHVKLEGKKLVHLKRVEGGELPGVQAKGRGVAYVRSNFIDVEEFQYNYKCKHCGHEWSENHIEEHREG